MISMEEKQYKQPVHFLHIGKTGGSAIMYAIKYNCTDSHYVVCFHPHVVKLRNIPKGERFFSFCGIR